MIKVSIMYPHKEEGRFDIDYYTERHMPMVGNRLGEACKGMSVDYGMSGGAPGKPPPYFAIGHLLFDSVEVFQSAYGPHNKEIMADVANYTDVRPVVQISEVRM